GFATGVPGAAGCPRLGGAPGRGALCGTGGVPADLDQPLNDAVALRFDGMFEHAGSFRDAVDLNRYGVTPTVTIVPGTRTKVTLRYEYLHDTRVADRGIPSFAGLPADVDIATYFGNPADSHVHSRVNIGAATVEHRFLD